MTLLPAPAFGQATLTNCDREPIHIPGAVQAHGVLLVLSEPDLIIRQASLSMRHHLELNAERMLGRDVALLLDEEAMLALRAAAAEPLVEPRYLPPMTTSVGARMEVVVHRTVAGLLLELEPFQPEPDLNLPQLFRRLLAAVHAAPNLAAIGAEAVRHLRTITGFDRVMLYRFLPDGAGHVIAEDRRPDLEPFLGLHYPATDIPVQARALMVLSPLRIWAGAEGLPAALVPAETPATGTALDMSRCVLRAVSPIHLEYLGNMGVRATLTMSIIRDGMLWGMIACHHMAPRRVPHAQRIVCESLAHLLTAQIETKQREERSTEMARLLAWSVRSVSRIGAGRDWASALHHLGAGLLEFVGCAGAAVQVHGQTTVVGTAPAPAEVVRLASALQGLRPGAFVATHCLAETLEEASAELPSGACGMMAVPVGTTPGDYVMWFRSEFVRSVSWAGDPAKPMVSGPGGDRLTPRGSFAEWVETVRGSAEPWSDVEIEAAHAFHLAIREVTARSLARGPTIDGATAAELSARQREVVLALAAARDAEEQLRVLVASLQSLAEGLQRG